MARIMGSKKRALLRARARAGLEPQHLRKAPRPRGHMVAGRHTVAREIAKSGLPTRKSS